MDHQSLLLSLESLLDVNPLENFKILFSNLDASHPDSHPSTGRKSFPSQSLLRAIIFKNLKGIPTLTELVTELKDNPSAAIRCGFNILKPLPSVERFSSFLKNTHNKNLQEIRLHLLHNLIHLGIITGEYLSIDSCPLHHSKKYARQFILCPAFHPKFFSQKGCYVYVRIDQDIRSKIDYGSTSFKTDFKLRSGSERVFSRLLNICMQNPPVIGFKAVSNYVTITHISVLLVALTAAKNNMKDKIRFIKSFLPSFNP